MHKRHRVAVAMRLLLWASCVSSTAPFVGAAPALAQAEDVRAPVIALAVEPDVVPADALRAALEADLGVRVASATTAPASLPTLSVRRLPSGNVEVALVARLVPRASREVALTSPRPTEQVETLALIASNLVRNEAASLLPDLQPVTSPPAPPAPPPPAVPEPPPPSEVKLPSPCDEPGPREVGFDFVPGVGSSSSQHGRDATRAFSLGFVGTLSKGLHGFEASIGVNIKRASVCGAQLAVGANVARGALQGVQLALFNGAFAGLRGVQVGLINIAGGVQRGVQAGLVNVSLGRATGFKGGIVNYTHGSGGGFRGGVVNLDIGSLKGFQGAVVNVTGGDFLGVQGAVANYAGGRMHGVQGGVVNVAVGGVEGVQAGVVNVSAREVSGMQLGVVNYADKSDASIGLVSIVRRGRTSIDALTSIDDGVSFMGAVTHGGRYVHNTYGVGIGRHGPLAMLGIGVRVLHRERFRVDLDAIGVEELSAGDAVRVSAGLRVPVTIDIVRNFGVVVAPSYNVSITDDVDAKPNHLLGDTTFHENADLVVRGYPGITAGVRWEFDHGA